MIPKNCAAVQYSLSNTNFLITPLIFIQQFFRLALWVFLIFLHYVKFVVSLTFLYKWVTL